MKFNAYGNLKYIVIGYSNISLLSRLGFTPLLQCSYQFPVISQRHFSSLLRFFRFSVPSCNQPTLCDVFLISNRLSSSFTKKNESFEEKCVCVPQKQCLLRDYSDSRCRPFVANITSGWTKKKIQTKIINQHTLHKYIKHHFT